MKTSTQLNKKFKQKWLTALRSGKYEQGESELKTKGTQEYCCLGVACKIAGLRPSDISGRTMPSTLSPKLQSKLPPFFRSETVDRDHEGLATLADMNDNGSTFEEIADYIERNL